jgi:hypothetical protein
VHPVPGVDTLGLVKEDAADSIAIKRERKADLTALEADEFVEAQARESRNKRDAVGDAFDAADLFRRR